MLTNWSTVSWLVVYSLSTLAFPARSLPGLNCPRSRQVCQKALWRAKLQVFGLVEYSCLVLMDVDMLVVRNLDHLSAPELRSAAFGPLLSWRGACVLLG